MPMEEDDREPYLGPVDRTFAGRMRYRINGPDRDQIEKWGAWKERHMTPDEARAHAAMSQQFSNYMARVESDPVHIQQQAERDKAWKAHQAKWQNHPLYKAATKWADDQDRARKPLTMEEAEKRLNVLGRE